MITVTLTPLTFDTYGPVAVRCSERSRFPTVERRVSRSKTLDLGYAIDDFGQADCDSDMRLVWEPEAQADERVDWLVRSYAQIYCACKFGFYRVAPSGFQPTPRESILSLLVLERLAS